MTPESLQPLARAVFRVMLSTIFLVAGLNHLVSPEQIAGRLAEAPMASLALWLAPPTVLVVLAGIGLLVGGTALALGLFTRLAALLLISLIVPITLTVQVGSLDSLGPLFKNVGLTGGLLYFAAHGADVFSLDGLRARLRGTAASTPTDTHTDRSPA